ncbi:hypothetical protein GCM10009830_46310 [Glycomyces endophyticus]|uniref:VCBS repeat-containing protein n=1 Tax=Glycomyces endophyticus TaxID=480996 RepID=A0ABP4TTE4_9ACTN
MHTRSRTLMRTAAAAATGLLAAASFAAPASAQENPPRNDYNGDGLADVVAVRNADAALLLYPGRADGTFGEPSLLAPAAWGGLNLSMAGDLTSDGNADLIELDYETGGMIVRFGDGAGGFDSFDHVGMPLGDIEVFASNIDHDGDGHIDLLATRRHDTRLFVFHGNGDGTFDAPVTEAGDFHQVDLIVGTGDLDFDGRDDFMVRVNDLEGIGFQVYRFHLSGRDGSDWELTDLGLSDGVTDPFISQVTFLGDTDGDGDTELVGVDGETGELWRMSASQYITFIYDHTLIGTGWDRNTIAEASADRAYDVDMNSTTDLFARTSSGQAYIYPGHHSGAIGSRISMGSYSTAVDYVENAGDFDGDNLPDRLVRTTTGELWVDHGWGYFGAPVNLSTRIGGGWNTMSAILSGSDYNGDGKHDIVAREAATGNLWLYPGTGDGRHGVRTLIGTGWNSMSLITTVGDLDHDGAADVIARKNADNCLYWFAGKPAGGLKNGVKIGCGWDVMNTIAAVGDYNGDGDTDWVARHANGNLYLYKGAGGQGLYSSYTVIGTGWGGLQIA